VAVYGARILAYAAEAAQAKQRETQVRLALLARGADGHLLFPEIFGPGEDKEGAEMAQDVSQDYDRVQWQVPSQDEWARIQAALASTHVQVPTSDSDAGWV
jgi:hypothetical protein